MKRYVVHETCFRLNAKIPSNGRLVKGQHPSFQWDVRLLTSPCTGQIVKPGFSLVLLQVH